MRSFLQKIAASPSARSSFGVMILQGVNLGTNFVLALVLANYLGTASLGVFTFVLAWVRLLVIPTCLGFPTLLPKELSIHKAQSTWAKFAGVWRLSRKAVTCSSLTVYLLAALVVTWVYREEETIRYGFYLGLLLIPLIAHNALRQGAFRALRRAELGALPESGIKPVLALGLYVAVYELIGKQFNEIHALGLNVLATAIAFVVGLLMLKKHFPQEAATVSPDHSDNRMWTKTSLSFLLIAGIHVVNTQTDKIMLGALGEMDSVGVYFVGSKIAGLAILVSYALNSVATPRYAEVFKTEGAHSPRLVTLVRKMSTLAFIGALGFTGVILLAGDFLLGLFGKGFGDASPVVFVLLIGQVIVAFCSSSPNLLNMTGHEKSVARSVMIGAISNVVLNAVLIPFYGMVGAAIATSSAMLICHALTVYQVHRKIGFDPTPLGFMMSKLRRAG